MNDARTAPLPRWAWIAASALGCVVGAAFGLPLELALRLAGVGALTDHARLEGSITDWSARTADGLEVRFEASLPVLLTGRYGGDVVARRADAVFSGRLVRDWSGALDVSDATLDAGLAPLAATLGMPPSMLEGMLRVRIGAATWDGGALTALACAGEVTGVRGGTGADRLALGDLAIACEDSSAGPVATIEDRGGPLAFRAELRFALDGRFLLDGEASARPGAPKALAEVLPLLGRSNGPGKIGFKYAGALPGAAR